MAGYIVAAVEVNDPDAYREYSSQVTPIVERFGGRFIVRGGTAETFEGEGPARLVVLEFPDAARARAFYTSPEYQAIIPIRQRHATTRFLALVEGA